MADKSPRKNPSDELQEAVLDAVLNGDAETFPQLNDAYNQALGEGIEVGHRGKKVKVLFGGGAGTKMVRRETIVVCPDCDRLLRSTGWSFESPDLPHFDHEAFLLNDHHYNEDCPAYQWRRAAGDLITNRKLLRRITHAGSGIAWRNLDYNHPIEGRLYRILKFPQDLFWKSSWALQRIVGWIEQPLWERRKKNI